MEQKIEASKIAVFSEPTSEQLIQMGLRKQVAYVPADPKALARSKNAERQARSRERKEAELKEANAVVEKVPAAIAAAAKEAGGYEALIKSKIIEKTIEKIVEVKVEVEVPARLSNEQIRLIELGRSIDKVSGIKRLMLNMFLSKPRF